VLEGYRLLFDHVGFPFVEPSFANVAPDKERSVHGVLHHITTRHLLLCDETSLPLHLTKPHQRMETSVG
jgi:hypothetical protein